MVIRGVAGMNAFWELLIAGHTVDTWNEKLPNRNPVMNGPRGGDKSQRPKRVAEWELSNPKFFST